MELPQTDNFAALLCRDTPMLDVRAPVEFAQGAFPQARNLPLLDDHERELVGTCYKQEGHDAAVELGARLVSGELRDARIAAWLAFLKEHPGGVLYCFRGGLRSQIAQRWLHEEAGLLVPRLKGGYKALRRFLIDQTGVLARQIEPLIICGRTGSGKTLLLKELDFAIDLEGLANHRGSSFGRRVSPQPTQIDFENRVAVALLKFQRHGVRSIALEDESPNIGSVHIPHALYERMREAPGVVLETPIEQRVEITLKEYISDMLAQFSEHAGTHDGGFAALTEYLHNSLYRVRRRLGGQAYQEVQALLDDALAEQAKTGRTELHRRWLQRMLVDYYDPMYDYQRQKRARPVSARGDFTHLLHWLREHTGKSPTHQATGA